MNKTTLLWAIGGMLAGYMFQRTLSRLPLISNLPKF